MADNTPKHPGDDLLPSERIEVVAVFGDLSGHLPPFEDALKRLGVDPRTATMPEDLVVVQVGDLVHRGPDGDAIVGLVDRMIEANPHCWVQLLGNHETQHIDGPGYGECNCSLETADAIRRWARDGTARLAVGYWTDCYGPVLITHAGLTRDTWINLGSPKEVHDAAVRINQQFVDDRGAALAPGRMLEGFRGTGLPPGVVWAAAGGELYASWSDRRPPFGQVHGHSSAYNWDTGKFTHDTPVRVPSGATLDAEKRHLQFSIAKRPFWGIDPSFGEATPSRPLHPLVLHKRQVDHLDVDALPKDPKERADRIAAMNILWYNTQ